MPWNWNGGSRMDVYQGGSRGSVEESKVTAAWPEYEADYLKRRLRTGLGKWDATNLNDAQQAVYLQEVAKHHETEADECLKRDFKLWLEGRHPTYNDPTRVYEGDAERRHVYRTSDGANLVTLPMDDWRATPWGTDQLTHLPGVRQFLRDEFEEGEKQTLHMNLLAEHGPQTLEEAWMYFKHWVAERPLSEAQCDTAVDPDRGPIGDLGNKALFGSMPHHMRNEGARAARPGAPPTYGSGTIGGGSSSGPVLMQYSFTAPASSGTKRPAETAADSGSAQERVGDSAPPENPPVPAPPVLPPSVMKTETDADWFDTTPPDQTMPVWRREQELDRAYDYKRVDDKVRYKEVKTKNTSTRLQARMTPEQQRRTQRRQVIRAAVEAQRAQDESRRAATTGYTRIIDREGLREVDPEKRDELGVNLEQRLRGGKARRQANPDGDPSLNTKKPAELEEPDTSAFQGFLG